MEEAEEEEYNMTELTGGGAERRVFEARTGDTGRVAGGDDAKEDGVEASEEGEKGDDDEGEDDEDEEDAAIANQSRCSSFIFSKFKPT